MKRRRAEALRDFHGAVAKIHAGMCPLCDGVLVDHPPPAGELEVLAELRSTDFNLRLPCDVRWSIGDVHDPLPDGGMAIGMGPMIFASRQLTSAETKRLYDRI